ncbi:TetR family transcriptional regulator [Streptomyces sp. NPDC090093]|uniref:TetR family transcriptional regulator n=1 Tax=Streptomyces sp. NPDC090093 TaxID=3365945 RepID=UPI00382E16A4
MGSPAPASGPPDPPRVAWRKQMRERVLEEAWLLTAEAGWDRVRMADLALRAEVSRPSVYAEFGDRAGVGRALVERETDRFLFSVGAVLESRHDDVCAALTAGVAHALAEAERNPFVTAVVRAARGGTDALLPFLTSRPEPVLSAARELVNVWLGTVTADVPPRSRAEAADVVVRLTISHMLSPSPHPASAPERIASVGCALLSPSGTMRFRH